MVSQNKGKDLDNIPLSKLIDGPYYMSKKYDGHYVQIQFIKGDVRMWTSGGKPFYLNGLANYIKTHYTEDFHIECEFNYNCAGKLGDRGKSAILTTYRTNYSKNVRTEGRAGYDRFRVLDIIGTPHMFKSRLDTIVKMFYGKDWFYVPTHHLVKGLKEAKELSRGWYETGFEGGMGKTPKHIYMPGKRVNSIVKFKPRKTADLLCIAWKEGTGKYEGLIGSLLLRDKSGREVWAGSGLSDMERSLNPLQFIGSVVEIKYERIDDIYIQPTIKEVRRDKTAKEID